MLGDDLDKKESAGRKREREGGEGGTQANPYCSVLHLNTSVFLKLELSFSASLWVLYSMIVSTGRFNTLFIVSLIFKLIRPSFADWFHIESMSSEPRIDNTTPQISDPTSNWSPMTAITYCCGLVSVSVSVCVMHRDSAKALVRQEQKRKPYQVLPIPTRQSFLQSNNPFSTVNVGRILPHWPHSLFEQMIVAHMW